MVFCDGAGGPPGRAVERVLAGVEAVGRGDHIDGFAFGFTDAAAVGSARSWWSRT